MKRLASFMALLTALGALALLGDGQTAFASDCTVSAGVTQVGIFVTGTAGGDEIVCTGSTTGHIIRGGAGNDFIQGGDGNDVIDGGAGNDIIDQDAGNDIIYGGDGNDTLFGDLGNDFIFGGAGDDGIHGGSGTDVCIGGPGTDTFLFELNGACEFTFGIELGP